MITDGFLNITVGEVLGLFVAIFGIYYVVKQLNETRLASQMEGMIALSAMSKEMGSDTHVKALLKFIVLDEWEGLSGEEAFKLIKQSDVYPKGYGKLANVYGLIGGLCQSGALDIRVADREFGHYLPSEWRRLEKYTLMLRIDIGVNSINQDWEWAAKEFEKLDSYFCQSLDAPQRISLL